MLLVLTRRARRGCLRLYSKRWYIQEARKFDILFMGRDEFSCGVFRELFAAPDIWNHLTIATHPDEKVGRRGSVLSVSPLKILGSSLGVQVHTIPSEKKQFRHWTLPSPFSLDPDKPPPPNHVLVTASFGRILPLLMLSQFPKAQRLNVHPSLLPAYRGPAPIQHAVIRGEKEVGVCVIGMLPVKKKGGSGGIDAGDVWGCRKRDVPESADFVQLRETLAKDGGQLLVDILRDMIQGTARAVSQPAETDEPHAPMISQADWTIDFSQLTAQEIIWRHRAISHQRNLTVSIPTDPVRTVKLIALVASSDPSLSLGLPTSPGVACLHKTHGLLVRCKEGTVLEVTKLKQEGKREMGAKDWWNGVKGMGIVKDSVVMFRT